MNIGKLSEEAISWMAWAFWETIAISGVPRTPGGPDIKGALAELVRRSGDPRLLRLLEEKPTLYGVVVLVDEAVEGGDLRLRALAACILADPHGFTRPFVEQARAVVRGEGSLGLVTLSPDACGKLSRALDRGSP